MAKLPKDNVERSVAFASRTLTAAERKYSTVEKEALPVGGQQKSGGTDHYHTTLLATKGIGCAGLRVTSWAARLLCFTYIYCPWDSNCAADCLSRLPLPAQSDDSVEPDMDFISALEVCLDLVLHRLGGAGRKIVGSWIHCWCLIFVFGTNCVLMAL